MGLMAGDRGVACFSYCRTLLTHSAITHWFAGGTLHQLLGNNTLVYTVSGFFQYSYSVGECDHVRVRQLATHVRQLGTVEASRTDSEPDLTIWSEFLKPTKSVWTTFFSRPVPRLESVRFGVWS